MSDTPLYNAYRQFLSEANTPFTVPGHKRNPELADPLLAIDAPQYGGVENRRVDPSHLARAERLAGELWGAPWCGFSVQGSSHGNHAIAMSIGKPGDKVIVSRTLHKSLFFGLVVAGLVPIWVRPNVDAQTGLPAGVSVSSIEHALVEHPDARAVMIVEPSYIGGLSDVKSIAELAHKHGIPLSVDAAWGAHLGFHPELPKHAMQLGADIMVTSIHKHLTGFTQSSLVLARDTYIDLERLEAAFEGLHTTSPSGAILASIDRARALLETDGEKLLTNAIRLTREAADRFRSVRGLGVVACDTVERCPALFAHDPTRIVLTLAGTGANGHRVADLLESRGVHLEFADRDNLCPHITLADTDTSIGHMVVEIIRAIEEQRDEPRAPIPLTSWTVIPDTVLSPRDAFFADHERIDAKHAIGRVAAESAVPYPPGIPALAPGERISQSILDALQSEAASGSRIAYCGDPTLETVLVVKEDD
ncbi:MAG: aminotransferase class V-fold PLP-dependent enzyme [Pseudomonadota bacterium]